MDVIGWVVGVPTILMLMVLGLDRLEVRIVAPIEPSMKIRGLVEAVPADERDREVAVMLAPAVRDAIVLVRDAS